MLKRILVFALTLTLLTGFYFFPAKAGDNDKLQRILEVTGLPPERTELVGVEAKTFKARLDRDLLVYGLPTDIPNNEWKPASTSWETDNNISLGYPGNQEPRYLGKTFDWNDFASDYFPDDAPNHVAPAKRDIIEFPWGKGYTESGNGNISDYSWGLIIKALASYHQRIQGFEGNENGFANNPAFWGNFSQDTVKDYFKVLDEPRPGLAGAVRHWHNRHDLGGIWYDVIFIRWDILPNFIVESIDPGADTARPGETYTGKVILKARPDASFISDPVTGQLFGAMGLKTELAQDYVVPFGVTVNGRLAPVKNFQPVAGLDNIFQYRVPAGSTEDRLEFTFDWTVPASPDSDRITLAAGVNESVRVLPKDVWGYMDWSEITNTDNVRAVEVSMEGLHDVKVEITPVKPVFTAIDGGKTSVSFKIRVTRKDSLPGEIDVSGSVQGFTGKHPFNLKLGPGAYEEWDYGFAGSPGSYTVEAEAWPDGVTDQFPADNRDGVTVTVENKTLEFDSKIRSDLLDN